jgi:hypothetical protein
LSFEDATKEEVREHLTETIWLVAESYGADRECEGCRTVVRRADRHDKPLSRCARHPGSPKRSQ